MTGHRCTATCTQSCGICGRKAIHLILSENDLFGLNEHLIGAPGLAPTTVIDGEVGTCRSPAMDRDYQLGFALVALRRMAESPVLHECRGCAALLPDENSGIDPWRRGDEHLRDCIVRRAMDFPGASELMGWAEQFMVKAPDDQTPGPGDLGIMLRWNLERREDGVYACDGNHQRSEVCLWFKLDAVREQWYKTYLEKADGRPHP